MVTTTLGTNDKATIVNGHSSSGYKQRQSDTWAQQCAQTTKQHVGTNDKIKINPGHTTHSNSSGHKQQSNIMVTTVGTNDKAACGHNSGHKRKINMMDTNNDKSTLDTKTVVTKNNKAT